MMDVADAPAPWANPPAVTAVEAAQGFRCCQCDRPFAEGDVKHYQLDDAGGICSEPCPTPCIRHAPVMLLVCEACGLAEPVGRA